MDTSIDLRQLRYFLAVADTLHFGRAAERLHISQPPLSRQVHQLEDQLGVALFVRGKAGVTLTAAGTAFLPEVRRTLAQVAKALAAARAARDTPGGLFTLGYTTVFDRSAIPDVSAELGARFPGWRLLTKGKHSISLVRDIKNGAMDAAFIGLHTEAAGLNVETLRVEPLVVALPAAHRLAARRKLGLDELQGEAMYWFERRLNPGYYDHCQAYFDRVGFRPAMLPEPADHHILLGLIAEGRGVALIPASLQQVRRQGVAFRPLKDSALSAGIAVAYSGHNSSPVLACFLELVHERAVT